MAAKQGKFALCGVIGEVKRLFEIGAAKLTLAHVAWPHVQVPFKRPTDLLKGS